MTEEQGTGGRRPDYEPPGVLRLAAAREARADCVPGSGPAIDCVDGNAAHQICNGGSTPHYCWSGSDAPGHCDTGNNDG